MLFQFWSEIALVLTVVNFMILGTSGEIRTRTEWHLRPLSLPIGLQRHNEGGCRRQEFHLHIDIDFGRPSLGGIQTSGVGLLLHMIWWSKLIMSQHLLPGAGVLCIKLLGLKEGGEKGRVYSCIWSLKTRSVG